ncbi:MAG: trypsin-like peptidase domain-containing protein [Planctomyces sp.]|nr:trypsin-like peptidase domain-containing protein [Planctomyces sp.]
MPESATSQFHPLNKLQRIRPIFIFASALLSLSLQCLLADEPGKSILQRTDDDHKEVAQIHLRDSAERLLKATVFIRSAGDSASGVLISDSGLILTTAHSLPTEAASKSLNVVVMLHDRRSMKATVLVTDLSKDLALLRLHRPTPALPAPLPIADVKAVSRDQLDSATVLAAGFPGREHGASSAVVRLGKIVFQDNSTLRSTCTLTAGDSGGPLVRTDVTLIGLHWRIGAASDHNQHVSAAIIRQFVADWNNELPMPSTSNEQMSSTTVLPASSKIDSEFRRRVVSLAVTSPDADSVTQLGVGTLLNDRHIAAKLSQLRNSQNIVCRTAETNEYVPAELIAHSRTDDLAILRFTAWNQIVPELKQVTECTTNEIVYASGLSRPGIISRVQHSEQSLPARFGASLTDQGASSGMLVTDVSLNSTAFLCGIRKADVLMSIAPLNDRLPEGQNLHDLEQLFDSLQPGDWVQVQYRRNETVTTATGQLSIDPAAEFDRTEFLDGRSGPLSARRSGFNEVLQHDIPISPESCGGPLLNSHGELIGINIARRSRESTLALPISRVLQLAGTAPN